MVALVINKWMPENLCANWRNAEGVTGTEIVGELRHALKDGAVPTAHNLAGILGYKLEIEWTPTLRRIASIESEESEGSN